VGSSCLALPQCSTSGGSCERSRIPPTVQALGNTTKDEIHARAEEYIVRAEKLSQEAELGEGG
jgi:hypothetical protein